MSHRILVVETDLHAAIATQRALALAGFVDVATVCAEEPYSAVLQAQHQAQFSTGVIITDGLNNACVGLVGYRNTPTIIYTGAPVRYEGRFGAVPVISKPDAAAMVAAVRRILGMEEGA